MYSNDKIIQIIPYLNKFFSANSVDSVALSKSLKAVSGFKESIDINILNGKTIKENMILKVLKYISYAMKVELSELDITILVNDNKARNLKCILNLAEKVKTLKLVTNNEDKFKTLEEKLQEIMGILIRVTNNKRKGLAKEGIIINIDFSEEQLNKYTINPNAIIVNIQNNVRIKAKRFNGIIVNDIKLGVPLNYKMKFAKANVYYDFEEKELYEASICFMDFGIAQNQINKDNIYIESLIGNNGPINTKEFEEKCKFCVKTIDKTNILN